MEQELSTPPEHLISHGLVLCVMYKGNNQIIELRTILQAKMKAVIITFRVHAVCKKGLNISKE
jgi:hypothetical protein